MYYIPHSHTSNRTILATYDETKVANAGPDSPYAWFHPYGNAPKSFEDHHIETRGSSVTINDKKYDRVEFTRQWLSDQKLSPLPAVSKSTIKCDCWSPYGSKETYWSILDSFPEASGVGKAIISLASHPSMPKTSTHYAALQRNQTPEKLQALYGFIHALLTPLLHHDTGDQLLKTAMDNALPRNLPSPVSTIKLSTSPGDRHWKRTAWQWQLMYAIGYGIAMGKLGSSRS